MGPKPVRFRICDLLVLAAVTLGLLTAGIPGCLAQSREQANRAQCKRILSAIGKSILMYANENVPLGGQYPRGIWDPDKPQPVFYTNPTAPDPFKPGAPGPNDVTAAFYLLLRTQDSMTPDVFLCPSDPNGAPLRADPSRLSNFANRQQLSYSYANPYATREAAEKKGFKMNYTLGADFALVSDINPGGAALLQTGNTATQAQNAMLNSPNHGGQGQNVLYADGHVAFLTNPLGGPGRGPTAVPDNIFTAGGGTTGSPEVVVGAPVDQYDVVLLPIAPEGPATAGASVGSPAVFIAIGGIVMLSVITGVLLIILRSRRGANMPPMPPA